MDLPLFSLIRVRNGDAPFAAALPAHVLCMPMEEEIRFLGSTFGACLFSPLWKPPCKRLIREACVRLVSVPFAVSLPENANSSQRESSSDPFHARPFRQRVELSLQRPTLLQTAPQYPGMPDALLETAKSGRAMGRSASALSRLPFAAAKSSPSPSELAIAGTKGIP
jgi:hypothetical protein